MICVNSISPCSCPLNFASASLDLKSQGTLIYFSQTHVHSVYYLITGCLELFPFFTYSRVLSLLIYLRASQEQRFCLMIFSLFYKVEDILGILYLLDKSLITTLDTFSVYNENLLFWSVHFRRIVSKVGSKI